MEKIMKSYAEIKAALHTLREKENALIENFDQLDAQKREIKTDFRAWRVEKPEAHAKWEKLSKEQDAIRAAQKTLEMEKTMLQHNARLAFFHEVMPILLNVLRPFIGKPYGEKTAEKINALALEACGRRLRIVQHYGSAEYFISTPDHYFEELTMCAVNDARILIDNKIQEVTMENLRIQNEKTMDYIYDVPAEIERIRALRAAVLENMKALKQSVEDYNDACPVWEWVEDCYNCKYISPID